MTAEPILTREIASLPPRSEDAHKGDVGRVVIIGGCCDADVAMAGAPALTANAAFRSGCGLVQVVTPELLRSAVIGLAPCATTRSIPNDVDSLLRFVSEFEADVVAFGPGLGDTITVETGEAFLSRCPCPLVVDADGLNLMVKSAAVRFSDPSRVILTPHPGEAKRLLAAVGRDLTLERSPTSRRQAACALHDIYRCVIVLKGRGTIVTNGDRLYVNGTGNAGMATGGSGDVLTGIIAALVGQGLECFEAAILGVFLHGLAGDFAAEELGRYSMTALDIIEYLPEAFSEHEMTTNE